MEDKPKVLEITVKDESGEHKMFLDYDEWLLLNKFYGITEY